MLFRRLLPICLLFILLLFVSGCLEFSPVTIRISPVNVDVAIGKSVQLTAIGKDANGAEKAVEAVWSVEHPTLGSFSTSIGKSPSFTAKEAGDGVIRATTGALQCTAILRISEAPRLDRVVIEPDVLDVSIGSESELTASGYDQFGVSFEIYPNWSLIGNAGSLLSSSGRTTTFRASSSGVVTILASVGEIAGSSFIEVMATPKVSRIVVAPGKVDISEGESVEFHAYAFDQYDEPIEVSPIWSISGASGTFSPSSGEDCLFTATGFGNGIISASFNGISGTASINIAELPRLARIDIAKSKDPIIVDQALTFTADGFDQYGNYIYIIPEWSMDNPIGSFTTIYDNSADFLPVSAGTTRIRASCDDVISEIEIEILPSEPKYIDMRVDHFYHHNYDQSYGSETDLVIRSSYEVAFVAIVSDQYGKTTLVDASWELLGDIGDITEDYPDSFFVMPNCEFWSSLYSGSGILRARFEDFLIDIHITVIENTLRFIFVDPSECNLSVGQSMTFSASGYDVDTLPVPIHPLWALTNPIGTLSGADGLYTTFTAVSTGTARLIATYNGIKGEAIIQVTNP